MKRLPYIYIVIFPYIFYSLFILTVSFDNIMVITLISLCIILIIACIFCLINSLKHMKAFELSCWNLLTKLAYTPIYIYMLFLTGGMMNPFLLLVSWVPTVISVILCFLSATANIGACINLFREKKCKLFSAIIFALLSYIIGIDIISAIIQFIRSLRKNQIRKD